MSGGGGGQGEQRYNWNSTLEPKWQQLLTDATGKAYNNQYTQYPNERIAGFNTDQQGAMQAIRGMTAAGGTPAAIAANNQAEGTLADHYLTGAGKNPYEGMSSPYFRQMQQGNMQDIADSYQRGTAADTTRMFNLSGAFGGSAHQQAIANNEAALGKTLKDYATQSSSDQYNRSAGMYGDERNRQIQALGAGQNANNLFFQGANAWMGVGDAQRGLSQDYLNQAYNDWQDSQNIDFKNADWLSGLYGRAQGGMSPNSTTTQSGYAAAPISQLLGAGLLAYGAR